MRYSANGCALTEYFENCKLRAFQDTGGVWTIGYGHIHGVKPGDECSKDQAAIWLSEDVNIAESAVNRLVKIVLTQNQFDALVDFCFNVGTGAFANSTLLKYLNASKIEQASNEFKRWDMDDGRHIAGLANRRKAEENLFDKIGSS